MRLRGAAVTRQLTRRADVAPGVIRRAIEPVRTGSETIIADPDGGGGQPAFRTHVSMCVTLQTFRITLLTIRRIRLTPLLAASSHALVALE